MSTEATVSGASSGFAQKISAGGHTVAADEAPELGGTGTGPSPHELLLSALGACTSMTVSMYARRKGWPLQHVDVKLTLFKVDDKGEPSVSGTTTRIDRQVRLTGPLSDEQRERLLEIANKCPVHKTLTHPIDIHTSVS